MKNTIYNIQNLVKISYLGRLEPFCVRYKKEKRFLGLTISKEGFYNMWPNVTFIPEESALRYYVVKDGIAFEKEFIVRLTFSGNHNIEFKKFDTEEAARNYIQEISEMLGNKKF
jgi:hypothetical protein